MTSLWDCEASMLRADRDLVGYDVEATDGSIGTIDEATNDAAASYLVVDTGFCIFGTKRLIPAGVIHRRQRPHGLRVDDQGPDQVGTRQRGT